MSRPERRGGSRRHAGQAHAAIQQIEAAQKRNPFAPMAPLSEDQLEFVHEMSMRILEEQGIEVMGEQALAVFRRAGAEVRADGLVKIDRHLLLETIAHAPESFTVKPRNPARSIEVGGNAINFGLTSGPPNVHDALNGRRAGNIADYRKLIQLGQYFNVIDFFGNQATAPTDLPANTRHMDTCHAHVTLADKPFFATAIGAGRCLDQIKMAAIGMGLTLDEIKSQPIVMTNINVNSPRKLDDAMAYAGMQFAMHGQPVAVTPFTLMGAMTPATMAGALAQQNAEALMGIALLQLVNPGTPVIYGGFTSNVDMRSGAPAFGTPENSLANMAGGQLARRYQLPYRTSACNASNAVDAQAAYETQMALWGATMGHGNLIYHAAGWLEGGLVASFEKLVLDCEMLQQMSVMLKPLVINEAETGLDAMAEVGPGGHFLGCEHTQQRYKQAFYAPFLSDWKNFESWSLGGAKTATERATELWQKVLNEAEAPALDPAIREHLDAYMAKRKESLGNEAPALAPSDDASL